MQLLAHPLLRRRRHHLGWRLAVAVLGVLAWVASMMARLRRRLQPTVDEDYPNWMAKTTKSLIQRTLDVYVWQNCRI